MEKSWIDSYTVHCHDTDDDLKSQNEPFDYHIFVSDDHKPP